MNNTVYILGGHQTDFARNWYREGLEIFDLFKETLEQGLHATGIDAADVEAAHVGNFTAELFCNQGHLGGFFAEANPKMAGIATGRHEAACASSSIAMMAASAEIEAGRYGLVAVLGIEIMRNVPGDQAALNIGGPAMWAGHECQDIKYPWPHMFSTLGQEYQRRYGLKYEHLAGIADINFANARKNPNSQTRKWAFTPESFTENDEANPVIDGIIRRQDCGQVTDGAAIVFLANERTAEKYAKQHNIALSDIPRIKGWGHRTAAISYASKIAEGTTTNSPYIFPHVHAAIQDALGRAGCKDVFDLDAIETHDCFTTTEYMAIDHFGITAPGESWKAVEDGTISMTGRLPINPSGGLIGLGHPVGATGARMVLDAYKQVTGAAGDYQVDGAKNVGTLNIGGSATTTVSLVIGTGE
ncbi:acetyl-CoA acetyltransferase [Kordiimonas sediminis]|uniref:Acetyl-CoA acetyltransferase n=1 Tax=Kordiimonas sediminis TaxID=1735581 RepID=A0A919E411_9PROT|nr:acetyl-CoA acetyltransferase [Kordiimonas sediminis]GHF17529.1 acetyl-CoA acetyltransferase [Kordiimonas sediminis]